VLGLSAMRNCSTDVVATQCLCVVTVTCSSEFVVAFLLHRWLPVRTDVLLYTYIVCVCVRANRYTAYNIVGCVRAAVTCSNYAFCPHSVFMCFVWI
jgi:hypothetical protein